MEVARGSAVGLGTALQAGRSRVRFPLLSLEFFIDIILPTEQWTIVMKSGSLKLMECPGPVQGLIRIFAPYEVLEHSFAEFVVKQRNGRRVGVASVM